MPKHTTAKRRDRYHLISLGCAKNTVDSDGIAQILETHGMQASARAARADVLIVNTCGFIDSAKQESIAVLRELIDNRQPGQMVIAAGCLAQRYGATLVQELPGLDGVIGTRRWMDVFDLITRLRARQRPEPLYHLPDEAKTVGLDEQGVLRASVQGASAYLKIADGCRRPCAFCAIPAIKGTAVSRPLEAILADARRLRDAGVREINLIAQDTTDYGYDLGLRDGLAHLLDALVTAVPDVPWIRILYAYPGFVTPRLMDAMAGHPQVLPYLDIPLQHGHAATLKRMKRPSKVSWVYDTIGALRERIPRLAVRTTFIVGYPGETDEEFAGLMKLVEDLRFDRVGAFPYSYEIGTPSALLPDHVPDEVKQARYAHLMARQQAISLARNQSFIGQALDVLVEGQGESETEDGQPTGEHISLGRSYRDAPEIDGYVFVEGALPLGEIVPVRVTGATAYDLIATPDVADPMQVRPGQIIEAGMIQLSGAPDPRR
jgi:ribosomal protein S12 methylthiotransferase